MLVWFGFWVWDALVGSLGRSCVRCGLEHLPTLQRRQRWVSRFRNVEPGDDVLVVDDDVPESKWCLSKVTETFPSRDGLVRKVSLRTGGTVLYRPVHKLLLLLPSTDLDLGLAS